MDKALWKSNRRALNSAFSVAAIKTYIPHFNEKSRKLINRMHPYLIEAGDLHRSISVCMMDISTSALFGIEMNLQESELGDLLFKFEKTIVNSLQYRFPRV